MEILYREENDDGEIIDFLQLTLLLIHLKFKEKMTGQAGKNGIIGVEIMISLKK